MSEHLPVVLGELGELCDLGHHSLLFSLQCCVLRLELVDVHLLQPNDLPRYRRLEVYIGM